MKKDRLTVSVPVPPYIKAFVLNSYKQESPVFFPRKSKENALLHDLLEKQPKDYIPKPPDETGLEIVIPYFEDKNITSYNFLSDKNKKILLEWLKLRLREAFFSHMLKSALKDIRKYEAVYQFIEKYNLPLDTKITEMMQKDFYRSRQVFRIWGTRHYIKKDS